MSAAADLSRPRPSATGLDRMSATRADLYSSIHKALRLFMSDTLAMLGRVDADDEACLRDALEQLEALLSLLRRHISHETDFVHVAIEARLPGASSRVADEHLDQLHSISELEVEAHTLRLSPLAQRRLLAHQLYLRFALFVADKLRHMHSEEIGLNAALWAHYSDGELTELHARMVTHMSPRELAAVTRWLVPAVTPPELVSFIGCMQGKLSAEAFTAFEAHAQQGCDAARWALTMSLLRARHDVAEPASAGSDRGEGGTS
ncbi:hypothetical protein VVD49_03530 [Uliginosibacterium sp. H3]|uniref:Hemerythrin-like domain-containing protein n=1 Tax=Uliginosibacterium silvisoli TaxID=3114758 RepID=A0ABU6JZY0_9RHOO|nr:hypothetical protein [Uliginosibacterium sp. H3]